MKPTIYELEEILRTETKDGEMLEILPSGEVAPMSLAAARGFAAHCWCDKRNSAKVMDVDLAESFAETLRQRVNEAVQSDRIKQARWTLRSAFQNDEGFRLAYVANIAMLLHDRYGITDYDTRNRAAEDLLDLIFG